MQSYFKHFGLLVRRLLLVLLFMTLTRLVFYLVNIKLFTNLGFGQVLLHFIYGIRFDVATIAMFNIVFVFFSVFPVAILENKGYQLFLKILFYPANIFMLVLNMVDSKFYEFEGKRLSADFFTKEWLGNEFWVLLPDFIHDYWYLFIAFIVFVYLFIKLYPKYRADKNTRVHLTFWSYVNQSLLGLFLIFWLVIIGRGGFQLKPIGIIAAAKYTSPEYIGLVLNSPFTVVKTMGRTALPAKDYFTQPELTTLFNPVHDYGTDSSFNKKNVVIIILESFGREYSGLLNGNQGFTPNLDSIMERGLTFTNAYANGKRSIDALPAILSSIPNLMDNAFITSLYSSNKIESLGELLRKEGYQTSFYHGGQNGTMGFDNFTKLAGVENYFGLNEYPNKEDFDGNWGIFDEPYLQYFCEQVSQMQQPFFTSVFTLSSHHPYTIPEKYTGRFPKGKLVNQESIGYADYALGEFFKTASHQPWFKNTLFVLSADHTAQPEKKFYKTNVGKYAIPIIFYAPGDSTIHGFSDRVCQQADIFPSVLDYLHFNKPFVAFGTSVFSNDSSAYAVSYSNGLYQLIHDKFSINFNGKQIVSVDSIGKQHVYPMVLTDTVKSEVVAGKSLIKAIIQQFNARMEHNEMIYNAEKELNDQ